LQILSAITHAANLKAPLLIIHGANDPRCQVEQARIFRNKLLELHFRKGKHFEYAELGEEGRGSPDPEQKIRKIRIFEILADFLERRVLKKNKIQGTPNLKSGVFVSACQVCILHK